MVRYNINAGYLNVNSKKNKNYLASKFIIL